MMEPAKGNISVTKTARYFTVGEVTQPVNVVLFVLHGYGMNASEFIKEFSVISEPGTLIVAPEGLSRYYRKGFAGEVVASWMTREDRQSEIDDYITYLNKLYDHILIGQYPKIFILGFSQGASTASRWIMAGKRRVDGLVIWSGEFAPDVPAFNNDLKTVWQVNGDSDEFIDAERFQNQTQSLEGKGFKVNTVIFKGGHAIDQPTLLKVWNSLRNTL